MLTRSILTEGDYPLVEWAGDYHSIPVRIALLVIDGQRWLWQAYAAGIEVVGRRGEAIASSEELALRRALACVAQAFELTEAPATTQWELFARRLQALGFELDPLRRKVARELARTRQATLPGIE